VTPRQWQEVKDRFHEAREKPAEARQAFLVDSCSDKIVRAEVERLLEEYSRAGGFLSQPGTASSSAFAGGPFDVGADFRGTQRFTAEERLGTGTEVGRDPIVSRTPQTLIDRYRLLQKIGEGGMGEVWLAEQEEPVRRQVALKMIKAGADNREVIARFESERQALAMMNHPAIARVFDAGSTPGGTPYFVMEYTPGVPITNYCDDHRLSVRQRLELFMLACDGVQHAHQKAVIHRDLKPSNILVSETDGRPAPKIIDFGIAKALTVRLTENTMFTRAGVLIGTPEYMSPEQASTSNAIGSNTDIDTRTDVYSLGVILYKLLTGVPPLDLRNMPLEEFHRRLRDEEPARPSTKIRIQDPNTSAELARRRATESKALIKQTRGDLDSIALKALEKDPARRYGSPSDFAADIARYLRNEAVFAVRPSAAYRAGRFVRRHRGAMFAAGAFLAVLIAAAAISVWQSVRASREAGAARREAAVSRAVNDFLRNDLLAQAGASTQSEQHNTPDPDLKVRTALDRAAARIGGKFDRQPEVEAAIRDTIGQTYLDLGLYPEAKKHLGRALELHRQVLGEENQKTLESTTGVARAAFRQGEYPEAERLHSRTLAIQRRVLGMEHADTLESMNDLADVYTALDKNIQAGELLDQTVAIRRRLLGLENRETLGAMNDLGNVYINLGQYAKAEALDRQIVEIAPRLLGPQHPWTLSFMDNLAVICDYQGKYAQAEALHTKVIEIASRVLGSENPETLAYRINLADTERDQGKFGQAEADYKHTLETQRRVLGPEFPDIRLALSGLAFLYQRQGRYALAEINAAQVLARQRSGSGPVDGDTMDSAANLALACESQGKFLESLPLAREALDFDRGKRPDHWQRFRAESIVGASLAGQGKYIEAEPLLLEGYQGMLARRDRIAVPDRYHLDLARQWIVQFYRAWGKPEQAEEWKKRRD
jgi:tetratricopeptide (TPR) repeat protein